MFQDSMGSFEIYVNGVKKQRSSPVRTAVGGEAYTERCVWLFAPEEMEIEIRPTEESKGKEITIVAIGLVDNTR